MTANGSILTTSETKNTDLFWGIQGGDATLGLLCNLYLISILRDEWSSLDISYTLLIC